MQIQNNVTDISVTKQTSVSNANSTKFQTALKHFDDLYQKSQVSGVSTSLFTKALEGIGLHKGDDLKGIELLKEYGHNTGAPSVEAILKYGNTQQKSGNHNYMKESSKKLTTAPQQTMTKEIKKIDKALKINVSQAHNYYDVAKKLNDTIDAQDKKLSIDKISTLKKYKHNLVFDLQKNTPLSALLQTHKKGYL